MLTLKIYYEPMWNSWYIQKYVDGVASDEPCEYFHLKKEAIEFAMHEPYDQLIVYQKDNDKYKMHFK